MAPLLVPAPGAGAGFTRVGSSPHGLASRDPPRGFVGRWLVSIAPFTPSPAGWKLISSIKEPDRGGCFLRFVVLYAKVFTEELKSKVHSAGASPGGWERGGGGGGGRKHSVLGRQGGQACSWSEPLWTLSPEQDVSLSQGAAEKSPPSTPGVPAGWGTRDVGGVRW